MLLAEAPGMYVQQEQLDEELVHLAELVRAGDVTLSCMQLADFASKLDRLMRHEERALAFVYERLAPTTPSPLAKVKREHASLRSLIGLLAHALDRADERRGLELVARLRSVLMVHVAKEESLAPLVRAHL